MSTDFKFIDLFSGIGGTRLGFSNNGGKCVFSSEIDRFARQTYVANFDEEPEGDITEIPDSEIPEHDVLVAGFPCQPFSLAGVSKHNALGRDHGFKHSTQGTMFFEIERILRARKPKAFFLENVKNLKGHDKGRTFEIIRNTLTDLNYRIFHKVVDAADVVPQHRERIYIVGFKDLDDEFEYPEIVPSNGKPTLKKDVLEDEPDPKYTISEHLWEYLQNYAAKHKLKGNGFGYGLVDPNDEDVITRTLSARYHKDGSEILIKTGAPTPRRLTPRECARLMGFPKTFDIPVSDTQAYRQFGNSVVVPVVEQIAKSLIIHLKR